MRVPEEIVIGYPCFIFLNFVKHWFYKCGHANRLFLFIFLVNTLYYFFTTHVNLITATMVNRFHNTVTSMEMWLTIHPYRKNFPENVQKNLQKVQYCANVQKNLQKVQSESRIV